MPVVREVKLGDAQLTGVDNDFDAKPTGVELGEPECTTESYGKTYDAVPQEQGNKIQGKTYDAVPQEQGNKIQVYGLGQQGPIETGDGGHADRHNCGAQVYKGTSYQEKKCRC